MAVLKEGVGYAVFTQSGNKQPAMALEVIYTMPNGEPGLGVLWGPMRSYMFLAPSVAELEEMGFTFSAPSNDAHGHYTVRADDGQSVLFYMAFKRCL